MTKEQYNTMFRGLMARRVSGELSLFEYFRMLSSLMASYEIDVCLKRIKYESV